VDVTETALLTAAISVGGTLLTNAVGRFLSRKADAAQIRAADGDAAKDISDAVSTLVKPLREELNEVRKENTKFRSRMIAMEDEVANLKLELRHVNEAFEFLVSAARESVPDQVEHAIKIRKGDA